MEGHRERRGTPCSSSSSCSVDVVDAVGLDMCSKISTKCSSLGNTRNSHWTPTLRRVSLLNTLLFLGLALSRAEMNSRAVPAVATDTASFGNLNDNSKARLQAEGQQEPKPKPTVAVEVDEGRHSSGSHIIMEDWIQDDIVAEMKDDNEEVLNENESASGDPPRKPKPDVFIVATVDGTLAAVDSSTGHVLWKQAGKGSALYRSQHHDTDERHHDDGLKLPRENQEVDKLLQPLIATTTTVTVAAKHSATSDSSLTTAIPSIDGNVFLTTSASPGDTKGRTAGSSLTKTDITSLQDLVSKAPYVDSNGLFYVGSRHATAAAIDGNTGEILYVASADAGNDDVNNKSNQKWEDRDNVLWIGRVDYSVSVYNARSSTKEVQFSSSQIMSVNDMFKGKGKPEKSHLSGVASERAAHLLPSGDEFHFKGSTFYDEDTTLDPFSELVATPSGNLAYRNPITGRVEWVADEAFETPIAYAIHSSSGHSLAVDIVPDVTMPSQSSDYLTREIERQIELTLKDEESDNMDPGSDSNNGNDVEALNPPIVGALSNGQLYSMPLGRRQTSQFSSQSAGHSKNPNAALNIASTHHHRSAASSSSVVSLNDKHGLAMKMPLAVGRLPHQQDGRQYDGLERVCGPSSPHFPGCIFKYTTHRNADALQGKEGMANHDDSSHDISGVDAGAIETFQHHLPVHEHTQYKHDYEQNVHLKPQRQRNYRKILRILGSWLPPTIALIFVVSFELGRRKRQKDKDELKNLTDYKGVEGNELLKTGDISGESSTRQVIQITDQVLGYGGHGTVVFKGSLEGRNVAVKRMLKTYLASADREISLLIESDGHPNVVRYFLKEVKGDFVYLALELCDLSLHGLIGTLIHIFQDPICDHVSPAQHCMSKATKRLLLQIATGVRHLHSSRILHNDLKPANILLALSKDVKAADRGTSNEAVYQNFENERYTAKISDMGLGKMLAGQSSFGGSTLAADGSLRSQSNNANTNNVGIGPGTVGWMAPEAMRIKLNPSTPAEASQSGEASPLDKPMISGTRASRSVDIFSLGCIFYSTLVPGQHPFGEWYEREANIMHTRPSIELLQSLSLEAYDMVNAMIQHNPRKRPTAKQICEHPYFWTAHRKLSFLCDLSDRLETDSTVSASDSNLENSNFSSNPLAIEQNAIHVVGLAWDNTLYKGLTEQRYRTYDPSSVRDLLRLLRNKKNHFQDLDASVRQKIGSDTDGLFNYFDSCFPRLLMHCYHICCQLLPPDDQLVQKYSLISFCKGRASDATKNSDAEQKITSGDNQRLPLVIEEPPAVSQCDPTPALAPEEPDIEGEGEGITNAEPIVEYLDVAVRNEEEQRLDPSHSKASEPISANSTKVPSSSHGDTKIDTDLDAMKLAEPESETAYAATVDEIVPTDGLVLWEGSTAAKTMNCRGWIRSDQEWTTRSVGGKKRSAMLVRCAEDPKFRTRLCNHWDTTMGTVCPMRRKNKCVFAHGPVELRVKEGKKNRWGKLVDKNGNNANANHSGGEDTYGAARSIESVRKEEGKWNTNSNKAQNGNKKQSTSGKKKSKGPSKNTRTNAST